MTKLKNGFISLALAASGFISLGACADAQQAVHISPPSWWVGMKEPNLQLLLNYPDISNYMASTDAEHVTIKDVSKPGGKNYLVVDVMIDEGAPASPFTLTLTSPSGESVTIDYQLNAREQGSAQRKGFNAEDVIYLITPDRFANGDKTNDSVDGLVDKYQPDYKGGRHGGDIAGIAQHLDYIEDMGFTQIWTMPLLENAMDRYSYHGYSTTDYYQIDPRFGTNEAYRQLVQDAGEKGIGVIKDVVLNHIGSEHVWMTDRPSEDWVNNDFTFTPTSHRREALHDPHGVKADAKAHSDGWFVPTMPDLNQKNPYLAEYLIQHAIWWIEYAGLSGLRVDTYSYSDKDFLSEWTKRIMDEYPNLTIVGEEWSTNPLITSYWQAGTKRYDDYESALPSVMDFPLQVALTQSLKDPERWDTGLRQLYEILASDFVYGDPSKLVVFADNHDMARVMTQLDGDLALWDMAMTIVLTTRGIPQVFYGTELAMHHPGTDDHGILRRDFPGGFDKNADVNGFTGEGLNETQKFAQQRLKQLLNNRKQSPAIKYGTLTQYSPENGTYVYFRHTDDAESAVMVVVNKNDESVELDLTRFAESMQGTKSMTRWRDNKTIAPGETLEVEGKKAVVWTLSK